MQPLVMRFGLKNAGAGRRGVGPDAFKNSIAVVQRLGLSAHLSGFGFHKLAVYKSEGVGIKTHACKRLQNGEINKKAFLSRGSERLSRDIKSCS